MDLANSIGLSIVSASSRSADGNFLEDGESILEKFDNIQLILSSGHDEGIGTLYITERRVIWISSNDIKGGFAVDFLSIAMHAVTSDPESVNEPCLYIQIDTGDDVQGYEEEECEEEEDTTPEPELRLIPADAATLEAMFDAFCKGAERNPDPEAEEGHGNFFFDQSEALAGALDATAVAEEDEALAGNDNDRFEDAEEEDGIQNGEMH